MGTFLIVYLYEFYLQKNNSDGDKNCNKSDSF